MSENEQARVRTSRALYVPSNTAFFKNEILTCKSDDLFPSPTRTRTRTLPKVNEQEALRNTVMKNLDTGEALTLDMYVWDMLFTQRCLHY